MTGPEPPVEPHKALMREAIEAEGAGHRAVLTGDAEGARGAYERAADRYRASWEAAGPTAYGRLVGLLKAAVLAGDADGAAAYVRAILADVGDPSPPAAYALAVAALVAGEDDAAAAAAAAMRGASGPFERTARAIEALARRDAEAYRAALEEIVRDFEARDEHLTGVAFADTAAMLEALAVPRDLRAGVASPLLAPVSGA